MSTASKLASVVPLQFLKQGLKVGLKSFTSNSIRFFSSKQDDENRLTWPQQAYNATFAKFDIGKKIEKKDSNITARIELFKSYIEIQKNIQLQGLCLFESVLVVDKFNNANSLMDSEHLNGMASQSAGKLRKISTNVGLEKFLGYHIKSSSTSYTSQEHAINTREFIVSHVGHDVLSGRYLSALELQEHFIAIKQPVYTLCTWGDSEDKIGYSQHVIVVFGVDKNQQIYYYDVSDRLDTEKFSRIRTMHIDEFNHRRKFKFESEFSRSFVFYRKGK